ncbi:hypothetical protein CP974_15155 [Streptomyces fradiae ATCC 10745 = DSM 40063]|nr:hypothetical protein CP974_15155 [Streptomyces fradiae ATCC 10745 = DSM 40063]
MLRRRVMASSLRAGRCGWPCHPGSPGGGIGPCHGGWPRRWVRAPVSAGGPGGGCGSRLGGRPRWPSQRPSRREALA